MAQLEIQRKRGISPIWWILGLILLALLLWWMFAAADNDADVVEAPGAVAPVAGAMVAPVTDVAVVVAQPMEVVGRQVTLTSVPVESVVSDRGFWVGSGTQRLFVVRGNESAPATPPDGAIDAGQTVAVYGTVQNMPSDLTQQATAWNLKSTDMSALQNQPVYVQADSIRIVAR